MDWMCLLYYVLACLCGAFLSWLIFNKKDQLLSLQRESDNTKTNMADLLMEFNTYKEDSKAKIYTKDAEISLLKKKLLTAKDSSTSTKELEAQKTKYRTLQNKLLLLETTRPISNGASAEELRKMKNELVQYKATIKDKNATISRLKQASLKRPKNPDTSLQDKKIKKLRKKLKRLKKKNNNSQNSITVETLDVDKLITLLKKGDLTKLKKQDLKPLKKKDSKPKSV